jgi:Uma2 family endonuclease
METSVARMTVAEYEKLALLREGWWELHHGELVRMTRPRKADTTLQKRLEQLIESRAGYNWFVTAEMPFRPQPEYELWCADVVAVSRRRWETEEDWLSGAPEFVVEVLSPSNTASEMLDRERTCLLGGCSEFWTVDPQRRLVR